MRKLLKLMAAGLLMVFAVATLAGDHGWLMGNWLLTYDPDGDPQDRITFSEDGSFVTTEVASGRQLQGTYTVVPEQVRVALLDKGQVFMRFVLRYDDKKDKLYYESDNSGSTSHYTKIQR